MYELFTARDIIAILCIDDEKRITEQPNTGTLFRAWRCGMLGNAETRDIERPEDTFNLPESLDLDLLSFLPCIHTQLRDVLRDPGIWITNDCIAVPQYPYEPMNIYEIIDWWFESQCVYADLAWMATARGDQHVTIPILFGCGDCEVPERVSADNGDWTAVCNSVANMTPGDTSPVVEYYEILKGAI